MSCNIFGENPFNNMNLFMPRKEKMCRICDIYMLKEGKIHQDYTKGAKYEQKEIINTFKRSYGGKLVTYWIPGRITEFI